MTWVDPEDFHITVYFIGEVESTDYIKKIVEEATFETRPFQLFARGTDFFFGNKLTFYIDFHKEKMLYDMMEKLNEGFNDPNNKEIIPHLTIGRYKKPSKQQYLLIKKKIQNLLLDFEFSVNKIYLIESISKGKKPVYKKLAEFTLHE